MVKVTIHLKFQKGRGCSLIMDECILTSGNCCYLFFTTYSLVTRKDRCFNPSGWLCVFLSVDSEVRPSPKPYVPGLRCMVPGLPALTEVALQACSCVAPGCVMSHCCSRWCHEPSPEFRGCVDFPNISCGPSIAQNCEWGRNLNVVELNCWVFYSLCKKISHFT